MIGYIEGEVIHKEDRVLIVKSGAVGYMVSATPELISSFALGEQAALWTHLAVREDALDLYGFSSRDELGLFRLLIGISGIGPKSALGVLSLADVKTLAHAIGSRDSGYLTKVSGIGKKLAEKIILELSDKVEALAKNAEVSSAETEAIDALESLGYTPRDTREIVRTLAKEHSASQDIIRRALQTLGGR